MARTLEEIYNICSRGDLDVLPAEVVFAHFDLLEHVFGPLWREVGACRKELDHLMPEKVSAEDRVVASFGGVRLYQSCRSALHKLITSFVQTEDTDSFRTLRILGAEAQVGLGLSDLKAPLERAFGVGVKPSEITREIAIAADAPLSGMDRQRLRQAFATLDKLRALPKVSERGLLTAEPIGKMPKYAQDGQRELPLPPLLAAFYKQLAPSEQSGLRAVYRAAVSARLFEASSDIEPLCLIEPLTIAKILEQLRQDKTKQTSQVYLNRVIKAVLDHEPSARHPDAWEELKRVAARAGFLPPLDPLHYLKTRCAGYAPHQVSQERFDAVLRGEDLAHNRVRLQKAGKLLNELRSLQDKELQTILPAVDLLIPQRKKKSVPVPLCLPPDPWNDLMEIAKTAGLHRDRLHAIGAVRQKASKQGLSPREITHSWACNTLDGTKAATSRDRFRRGVECLDAMKASGTNSDLLPLTELDPLPDKRRKGNAMLPERLTREIKDHAAFRGLSHNGTRSILTAIAIVFSKARKKEMFEMPLTEVPLGDIVDAIPSGTKELPKNWNRICATARQLESEARFQWTDDWADLQCRVVAAGVPIKENPVPAIATVAQESGLSPTRINREWAWQHGRALRSDLKITWSRNVERFDALRSISVIESTRVLPLHPLGPMPKTGNRARHDIYPLPIEIECILENIDENAAGYSGKELRETVCFVWRYAREIGVFRQGDAPTIQQLLSGQLLDNLMQNGIHGLQSRAFSEHRRRAQSIL